MGSGEHRITTEGIIAADTSVAALLSLLDDAEALAVRLRPALEAFVGRRLADAGMWRGPRQSDGVSQHRVVAVDARRARVCGRIWDIAQVSHVFWLDLERPGPPHAWTLYFGLDPTSCRPRFAKSAHDVLRDPGEVGWVAVLDGLAA